MNKPSAYPIFKSSFLTSIVNSLMKRSKSIKHNVNSLHFQKVIEKTGDTECEKLETEFILQRNITVRLFLWDDRWSWIDIRESRQKKWFFEWQREGRIGARNAQDVVEALQNTFFFAIDNNNVKLDEIWNTIILKGITGQAT